MSLFSRLNNKKKIDIEKEDVALLGKGMSFEAREAYKTLRTNLMFTLPTEKKCKVVGVTSSIRSEGKSTTSINLAYSLSQDGYEVLLVDGDLRLPSLKEKLNVSKTLGLADMIVGKVKTEDEVLISISNNMDLLLSGTIPPNPSELLGSKKCKSIMERLQEMYDFIIIDLPPVNIVSDALVTKGIVDGVVVVVRENGSYKKSLAECLNALKFIDMNILGFVLTNSSNNSSHYSVNKYSYRYGKRYDHYGKRYDGYHEYKKSAYEKSGQNQ